MNRAWLYLGIILFIACAQKPIFPEVKKSANNVFADGVYKQDVQVRFKKNNRNESAEFKAILKKTPAEINMYAYVGFGVTLFKLKDNFKDAVEFTTNEPRIEKSKEFFLKMYPLIKEILLLNPNDARLKNTNTFMLAMPPENFPVTVTIQDYVVGETPRELTLENKQHFKFTIITREYAPLSGK